MLESSALLEVSLTGTIQSVYAFHLLAYLPKKKHLWFRHVSFIDTDRTRVWTCYCRALSRIESKWFRCSPNVVIFDQSVYLIGMTDSSGYCGLCVGIESGSEIGCQTNAL